LEVATMKKVFLFLAVAACAFVVGMVLMAPEPGKARAASGSVQLPAVPALGTPPVVLETSAVLVVADPPKEAPKPRPAPARPRPAPKAKGGGLVDCGNAKVREVEQTALGTSVRYCHN
jgi:hypothetical protein